MANVAQRAFVFGELSPSMYARTDQISYSKGLRTCRNFIVQAHGGIANRPGTEYVIRTKDDGQVQLVEWIFSASQTYVLEFGDRYLRFHQDGATVVVGTVTAWVTATAYVAGAIRSQTGVNYYCTTAHTSGGTTQPGIGAVWQSVWYALEDDILELPTPYLIADIVAQPLQYVQSSDVVTLVHPLYAPRELDRLGNTNWTLTTISFVPTIGSVVSLAMAGGVGGTIRYYAVTALDAGGREGLSAVVSAVNKVPSVITPTTLTWNPPASGGVTGYRVYRSTDGTSYGFIGPAGNVLVATTDSTWTTTTSTIATTTQGGDVLAADQCRNACVATAAAKAVDGVYTATGTITTTGTAGTSYVTGNVHAYYSRDGEARVDAGIVFTAPDVIGEWSGAVPFSAIVVVPDNGYATLTIDLVADVIGYADSGSPTFTCALSTAAGSIAWNAGAVGFSDPAIVADMAQGPPLNPPLFAGPGNYPSVVTYYQQRLLLGNTTNLPETIVASRTGDYHNITTTQPVQDDSSVVFTVAGRAYNPIKAMLDLGRLLILTEAGEYTAEGDGGGTLTPTGINLRQQLYQGATSLPPLVIGYAAIYLQARGNIVRDIVRDYYVGFKSSDLTLLSTHLFQGYSIVDWDFQQVPGSILWAVRSDGILVALTYLVDQDVLGWHHHDTDGFVENVCVVPEGTEDAVYLCVRRTIDGETTRSIERMASRTITDLTDIRDLFYVDCGLTFDGRNTGATTMRLTGSVWDGSVLLTCTASLASFTSASVGDAILFYDTDGLTILVRAIIEAYTSTTVVSVRPDRDVPVDLQATATTDFGYAIHIATGLEHLEGKDVSVYGDGYVVASPNNAAYPVLTVTGGEVALGGQYAVVSVGLPYISDMETLDIDTPSGASIKPRKMLINAFTAELLQSRGGFVGGSLPTGSDPLAGLDELKVRDDDDEYNPIALRTESYGTTIQNGWNSHGRVCMRNVDPIPLNVLAVIPEGMFPPAA